MIKKHFSYCKQKYQLKTFVTLMTLIYRHSLLYGVFQMPEFFTSFTMKDAEFLIGFGGYPDRC